MVNPFAISEAFPTWTVFKDAIQTLGRSEFRAAAFLELVRGEFAAYMRAVQLFGTQRHERDENNILTFHFKLEAIMKFWQNNYSLFPNIAKVARFCMTLCPSSAAAERVFSVMKNMFSKQQLTTMLEDYSETGLMLAYNKHEN